MTTLAPHYRLYDLPWSPTEAMERRFRKILRNAFILFAVLSVVVPFLPVPERARVAAPEITDRIVKLVIEKAAPVAPPVLPPKPEKRLEPVIPRAEHPQPVTRPSVPDARQKAQQSGLLRLQDHLAELRDSRVVEKAAATRNLSGAVGGATRSDRALITSAVGVGSGGIDTAELSRGYGRGAGSLDGHTVTQVTSSVLDAQPRDTVQRASGSIRASRSEEEIALVFDRHKGAIHAIYTRALRDRPDLQGKLVLELTIAPDGEVTRCQVVSSELDDAELERRLVARVKMFRFEDKDVGAITVTKPIDFFPA